MIDSLLACSPQAAYRATALQQRPLSSSVGLEVVGFDHEALPTPQDAPKPGGSHQSARLLIPPDLPRGLVKGEERQPAQA
jgi:hypothetical protein